jgi:hypothetical protein
MLLPGVSLGKSESKKKKLADPMMRKMSNINVAG